jgi:hypothetical protein
VIHGQTRDLIIEEAPKTSQDPAHSYDGPSRSEARENLAPSVERIADSKTLNATRYPLSAETPRSESRLTADRQEEQARDVFEIGKSFTLKEALEALGKEFSRPETERRYLGAYLVSDDSKTVDSLVTNIKGERAPQDIDLRKAETLLGPSEGQVFIVVQPPLSGKASAQYIYLQAVLVPAGVARAETRAVPAEQARTIGLPENFSRTQLVEALRTAVLDEDKDKFPRLLAQLVPDINDRLQLLRDLLSQINLPVQPTPVTVAGDQNRPADRSPVLPAVT